MTDEKEIYKKIVKSLDYATLVDEIQSEEVYQDAETPPYLQQQHKAIQVGVREAIHLAYEAGKTSSKEVLTRTATDSPDEAHIREYLKKYFNVKAIEQLLGSKTTSHADWRDSAICMLIQKEREQEYQRGYEAGYGEGKLNGLMNIPQVAIARQEERTRTLEEVSKKLQEIWGINYKPKEASHLAVALQAYLMSLESELQKLQSLKANPEQMDAKDKERHAKQIELASRWARERAIAECVAVLKGLENPYSPEVFIEPTAKEWGAIHEAIGRIRAKRRLRSDGVFGAVCRKAWQAWKEEAIRRLSAQPAER